jgi:hypothetical protein
MEVLNHTLSGAVLDNLLLQPFGFNTNVILAGFYLLNQVSKSNFYLDSSLQSKVENKRV